MHNDKSILKLFCTHVSHALTLWKVYPPIFLSFSEQQLKELRQSTFLRKIQQVFSFLGGTQEDLGSS